MTASITTEHGTYTGKAPESIVRREYGRDARIEFSADRNAPQVGMVLRRDPLNHNASFVLATLHNVTR
jgi:hypothetical protein